MSDIHEYVSLAITTRRQDAQLSSLRPQLGTDILDFM